MAENSNITTGGYKLQFVRDLDARLKCPICQLALRSPFQTICGHRYCESCIKNVINVGNKKCPEDGTVLSSEQIFRDVFCNGRMLEQECFCQNKDLGCQWTGQLRTLEEHLHTCPEVPLDCQKGCGEKVPRCKMFIHLAHDCPKAKSACPMIGQCDFQGSRADVKEHISDEQVEHTAMMNSRISSLETNVQRIDNATKTIEQRQQALNNQANNHRDELTSFRDDLAALRVAVDEKLNTSQEIESSQPLPTRDPQGAKGPGLGLNANDIQDIKMRLERLEDQLRQIQHRERQALYREQIGGQISDDLERRVATVEYQNTLTDVQIADHDVMINMLERTSYDGTFFWKIEDFGRLLQDAISGRCLSVYSSQFYVCRYGYKVCACAHLNGDGMGKGTHLSLFFVVMRGYYDALLPWPFQQKVSFKLIDQGGDQHIIDSFRPDPNNSSFQRPTSNMNIASGCPLFVAKSVLYSRGYIKDDTVFFKITVDTAGLPVY